MFVLSLALLSRTFFFAVSLSSHVHHDQFYSLMHTCVKFLRGVFTGRDAADWFMANMQDVSSADIAQSIGQKFLELGLIQDVQQQVRERENCLSLCFNFLCLFFIADDYNSRVFY